jgi:regulator of protease activity HflC (stomatin/prohibitin superfamily)
LHWSFPSPIDEVVRIPIGQLQTVRSTVGWYGTTPEIEASGQEPPSRPSLNPLIDGYTLTGDGNIIHVRATMRYRISDPLVYVFNFVSASNASAQFTVDRALRKDVAGLKEKILARVNELISQQNLGIILDPLDIAVSPPLFVKPFFNEVTSAEQEQGTAINTAQGYANALLSRAIGESNQVVNAGQTDRTRLLQSVSSEADTLTARLPGYQKNPRLFEQRLLTETWQRILTNAQDKYFLPDRADGGSRELRLLLNRELQKPAVTQTNQ